jgi:hypothetical protein
MLWEGTQKLSLLILAMLYSCARSNAVGISHFPASVPTALSCSKILTRSATTCAPVKVNPVKLTPCFARHRPHPSASQSTESERARGWHHAAPQPPASFVIWNCHWTQTRHILMVEWAMTNSYRHYGPVTGRGTQHGVAVGKEPCRHSTRSVACLVRLKMALTKR